jgi:hypothetical protein
MTLDASSAFLPLAVEHQFEDFTDDRAVWLVFHVPVGGEG